MTPRRSIASIAKFASLVAVLVVGARHEPSSRACVGGDPTVAEVTTFDPAVLGVAGWEPVYYDPFHSGFGGYSPGGELDDVLADWRGYLKGAVPDAEWKHLLLEAPDAELAKKAAGATGKLADALAFVRIARQVESSSLLVSAEAARKLPTGKLLAEAQAGATAHASDPFLAQRYAFQVVRIYFYQRDFTSLVTYADGHAEMLAGPSQELAYHARYYEAGALARSGKTARALFELAKIHCEYPPLAGAAATDFRPQNDQEWKDALALAKSGREKAEMWRLVGVKFDGVVAMKEIAKIDAKSELLPLLAVRELARVDSMGRQMWGGPDATTLAARNKEMSELEKLSIDLASKQGNDKGWVMNLVAGHIAALRGDVPAARKYLGLVASAKASNTLVMTQVKASLGLALSIAWRVDGAHEEELGTQMAALDASYSRKATVYDAIRTALAPAYLKANRLAEAEMLHPGTVDPPKDTSYSYDGDIGREPRSHDRHWAKQAFIKEMIGRFDKASTPWDRFVTDQQTFTRSKLENELAIRQMMDGDFAAADKTFATTSALSERLHTDPFQLRIKECHDCDHEKFHNAAWTHASVMKKLVELDAVAKGKDAAAAEANLWIATALYNMTWMGNARMVVYWLHQDNYDARLAETYAKRAYDLATNKEVAAKAAYLGAKAELEDRVDVRPDGVEELPVPTTWFARLAKLSDTKYYADVLAECTAFDRYVAHHKP